MPREGRRRLRRRRQGDRSKWSNPLEFVERVPAVVDELMAPLDRPSCSDGAATAAQISAGAAQVTPNVVHQVWLGGGKLMFAKLLSVLSVRAMLRPERHFLHYDEEPNDALEWRCACRVATCVQTEPRTRVFGRPLEHAVASEDRYASDRTKKCGSSVLDLMRIDLLRHEGGLARGRRPTPRRP